MSGIGSMPEALRGGRGGSGGSGRKRRSRRSRRARRKRVLRLWLLLTGLVTGLALVFALVVGGWVFQLAKSFDNRTGTITNAFPTGDRPSSTSGTNILFIGSDSRLGTDEADAGNVSGGRSDALMLLHLDGDGRGASVMSIMRDSWVDIPGRGTAKINAAYAYGGVSLTVATVEQLLDVRIDHVAEIGFEGFKGMTNALGGVDVQVAKGFTGRGHTFTQGENHLDGDAALAFVRERYAFADADHTRVKNQQAFIRGIADAVISRGTLTNPTRITDFVGTTADYLSVDAGLTARRVVELGIAEQNVRQGDVHYFTMPTSGGGRSADGQSYVQVNTAELPKLQQALRSDSMRSYFAAR